MRFHFLPSLLVASLVINIGLGSAIFTGVTTPRALSSLLGKSQSTQGTVTCWGDSLTAGVGANFGHDFPRLIGTVLGREVINEGIGGETSTQIKTRMLARAPGLDQGLTIIWAGRNAFYDIDKVQANIVEMVASLPADAHYFVLGILNGNFPDEMRGQSNYDLLTKLNDRLASTYGEHYLPIREYLISMYNPQDPHDIEDKAHDIVPASLRFDEIHLNNIGYGLVAAYLEQQIRVKGW